MKPKGTDHLEGPGLDGRVILRQICRKWGMDWIELTWDTDRWWILMNAVMNLRVP
jgi:Zn-dependent protease